MMWYVRPTTSGYVGPLLSGFVAAGIRFVVFRGCYQLPLGAASTWLVRLVGCASCNRRSTELCRSEFLAWLMEYDPVATCCVLSRLCLAVQETCSCSYGSVDDKCKEQAEECGEFSTEWSDICDQFCLLSYIATVYAWDSFQIARMHVMTQAAGSDRPCGTWWWILSSALHNRQKAGARDIKGHRPEH